MVTDFSENDKNWANSEVIKTFAENYFSTIAEPAHTDLPEMVSVKGNEISELKADDAVTYERTLNSLAEIDAVIRGLQKLASDTAATGHIKEAYEIERTIEDIRKIGLEILGEDKNV